MAGFTIFSYDIKRNPKGKRSPTPRPDFALFKNGSVVQLLDAKYRDLWDRNLPSDALSISCVCSEQYRELLSTDSSIAWELLLGKSVCLILLF